MIKKIIDSLNTELECLEYFENLFGLCVLIKEDKGSRPAQYRSNGELDEVSDVWDSGVYGTSYWRKTNDISTDHKESGLTNIDEIELTIPLKLIGCVKRSTLEMDHAYADDSVALNVIKKCVNYNWGVVKRTIGAKSLRVESVKYSTKREEILSTEFNGENVVDMDYDFVVFSVDFKVILLTNKTCLNECM